MANTNSKNNSTSRNQKSSNRANLSETRFVTPSDVKRRAGQILGLWLPVLLTLDKICAAFLFVTECALGAFELVQRSVVGNNWELVKQGFIPVDTGVTKYNDTQYKGVELLSATEKVWLTLGLHEIIRSLRNQGKTSSVRFRYLQAWENLIDVVNHNNQTGDLKKSGTVSLVYLVREAGKVDSWNKSLPEAITPMAYGGMIVLQQMFFFLRLYIDHAVHGARVQTKNLPLWVKNLIGNCGNNKTDQFTIGHLIVLMYRMGVGGREMKERAQWWYGLSELALEKNRQKKEELKSLFDDTENWVNLLLGSVLGKSYFQKWTAKFFDCGEVGKGVMFRSEDEDLVRETWSALKDINVIVCKKEDGRFAVLTRKYKKIDLKPVLTELKSRYPEIHFYHDTRINAVFCGTGNWEVDETAPIRIDHLAMAVAKTVGKVKNARKAVHQMPPSKSEKEAKAAQEAAETKKMQSSITALQKKFSAQKPDYINTP